MSSSHSGSSSRSSQVPQIGPYILGKTLGTGSTGKVKIGKHVETGQYVAVKIVRKAFLSKKPTMKRKTQREIAVMKLVDHPNVVKLLDVLEIKTHIFLVMEFVDGCELFDYLVRRGRLSESEALDFFQQLISGLEYCHKRLICHRDLKPENLLLRAPNKVLLIGDFGMTSLNRPGSLLETSCGSPHYCSPSVISGEKYNGLKADIWSCGVILYAMLSGRLPFDDENIPRLLLKVQNGRYRIPSEIPPLAQDLIKRMLVVDPEKRITIPEIKKHRWFIKRRPRFAPKDDFVLPRDPITNPDAQLVQGLVDLGWGDTENIVKNLADSQPCLERIFYLQLERHATFRDGKPKAPERATTQVDSAEVTEAFAKLAIQDPSAEVKENGEAEANGEAKESNALSLKQDESKDKEGGTSLIRQSSLACNKPRQDGPNLTEALKNAGPQNQKSWFDSVKDIFTGGGQNELGKEEKKVEVK